VPEFFGDTLLVNGKVWSFLEVEPRKYRFRILNTSNARFYHLTLNESTPSGDPLGWPGLVLVQIGTDGGFLPAPVPLPDLTIGPAERFDVILDFSGAQGKFFMLNNDAKAPFPDGDEVIPTDVLLFKVTRPLSGPDTSTFSRLTWTSIQSALSSPGLKFDRRRMSGRHSRIRSRPSRERSRASSQGSICRPERRSVPAKRSTTYSTVISWSMRTTT
jgi:hypothetical protein